MKKSAQVNGNRFRHSHFHVNKIMKIQKSLRPHPGRIFDLPFLLEEIDYQLNSYASKQGFFCKINFEPDTPYFFRGFPEKITEIICNLASHSLSHLRQGGCIIDVRNSRSDSGKKHKFIFRLTDTGPGLFSISPRLESILKRFASFDSTRQSPEHDNFYWSNELLPPLDGRITLESIVGWGVLFQIEMTMAIATEPFVLTREENHNTPPK